MKIEQKDNIQHISNNLFENNKQDKKEDVLTINRNQTYSFFKKNILRVNSIQKVDNSPQFIKGQCIGSGFYGQVFSGLSLITGEIVAIKNIKFSGDQSIINIQKQNVRDSVSKLTQLKHKNVIKHICIQELANDEIDLIIEYCNGGSIKQLIDKFSAFDEKLIKIYVKQILEGLVYLHDLGIVHRNIKNTNILVDGTGVVKISDLVVSNILIGDDLDKILWYNTMNRKGYLFLY